jgi:hypothetical protein
MEIVALIIVTWGVIGILCLGYIGLKKDIQHYLDVKKKVKRSKKR